MQIKPSKLKQKICLLLRSGLAVNPTDVETKNGEKGESYTEDFIMTVAQKNHGHFDHHTYLYKYYLSQVLNGVLLVK